LGGFGIVAPVSQKVEPPRYTGQFTYVLIYLAFFFVFAYLLKREYWKDVH